LLILVSRRGVEDADYGHRCLLRPGDYRPCRQHTSEYHKEISPVHGILQGFRDRQNDITVDACRM
jgi:hypothetical protein